MNFQSFLPRTFEVSYRTAATPTTKPPLQTDSHQIYHSLWPLPALSPVPRPGDAVSVQAQAENESAYRQLLVHGVLAVLLPTEDLENECLTSLVGQILSELVIGNLVAGKLSEPWLVWEILIMVTRLVRKGNDSDGSSVPLNGSTMAQDSNSMDGLTIKGKRSWSLYQIFWSFVHWVFLAFGAIRLIISIGALSQSLPPRPPLGAVRVVEKANTDAQQKEPPSPSQGATVDVFTQPARVPIIDFHIWRCIGDILDVEARMPWLRGSFSMMQWIALKGPGRVAALNGTLDRSGTPVPKTYKRYVSQVLMSHYIHVHVLDPARLPPLLRAIRAALFPNNAPGVSSLKPPSSGEQVAALRRRCASALWGLVPRAVGDLYYGTTKWPWSGVKACITANEGVKLRTDPLKRNSNAFGHDYATSHRGGADARSPDVLFPDENNPMMRNDATLSPPPKRDSQGSNRPDRPLPEYDNEDEARTLSEIEADIVDIFSDAYCNKHLIYGILELVLVRLVPELAEKGVGELWEERLH
ncbi:hypothetical protein O1611_g9144 [Lasiodiplodia mahajangana]|uniref:Uncharacterized protein n=1 Tax=Lasiodiplodia mahajangana TaxID=1108764 RepID=A0ACC2JAP7_9PEZI|nr:hypothetical protein O1611_g9144 [Lasiodiplodia mahajangana]